MVNLAQAGKIKKRVIAASSESEDEQPMIKRPKPDTTSTTTTLKPDVAAHKSNGKGKVSAAAMLLAAQAEASSDEDTPMANSSQPVTAPASDKKPTIDKKSNGDTKPVSTNGNGNGNGNRKKRSLPAPTYAASDSEEDKPLAKKKAPPTKGKAPLKKKAKAESEESDFEDEVKPKKPAPRKSNNGPGKQTQAKGKAVKKDESSSDEAPIASKKPAKPVGKNAMAGTPVKAKEKAAAVKGKKLKKEEEVAGTADGSADEEEYKWWEQQKDDDTVKWETLKHNGVLFPPEYTPLPKHVKMKYEGKPVDLPPAAEEVAGFFGIMINTDHVQKPAFVANFFADWKDVLKKFPPRDGTVIKEFAKCDFQPMFDYFELEREKKKAMTKDEKKNMKAEKDALEELYKYCWLDGRKEKVGNFRVEPPSLFRGRGEHPKTGMLKKRITPEQITINIGAKEEVPTPPAGHQWGKVMHNDKASWLAMWKENINGAFKYVFLAAGSSLKGQSDLKKFEKARNLKDHIERIRRDYTAELTDKTMATRQRATAMYLIDRYALRAGNEKGEDEADTVGCCSLRYEHITLEPPNEVTFDFLGKDSIRFRQTFAVDEQVFKNLKIFKKPPKTEGDLLFDRLTTTTLNKHLGDYMPGLSAKVFRTYNASWTFERELAKTPEDASVADKILAYNRANRQVAILCNHQRSVSKTHGAAMDKAIDKIRALKYQRRRLRWQMHHAEGYTKKKFKEYDEDETDLDDEWIVEHEEDLVNKEREKITKKFEKDNLKVEEDGGKPMKPKELEERLEAADDLKKRLKSERKAKKIEGRGDAEKIAIGIKKMDERIAAAKTSALDRDEGKTTSLGTSKINYIDPRLTYAWCEKYGVPVEKMFSKTLREKFTWAVETPGDWSF